MIKRFIKLYEEFTGGSSTEALTLPLGDGDKEKVKTALWDKLTNTPELKKTFSIPRMKITLWAIHRKTPWYLPIF